MRPEPIYSTALFFGLVLGFAVGRYSGSFGHRFVHVGSQYSSTALDTKTGMTCIARPKPNNSSVRVGTVGGVNPPTPRIDLSAGIESKEPFAVDPSELSPVPHPRGPSAEDKESRKNVFDHAKPDPMPDPSLPYCSDL